MSPTRVWAIVVVGLLHVLLGFALVYGLYTSTVKEKQEDLSAFDVDEPPPPEDPPPPPPPQPPQPQTPQQVVLPPQIVRTPPPPQSTSIQTTPTPNPPVFQVNNPPPAAPQPIAPPPTPPAPVPPPAPPASPPTAAVKTGGSISDADYPPSAIRAEAQGTTRVSIQIGENGRVTGCSVTGSSGNGALDQTACSLIQRRFRYRPATRGGQPVATTQSQSVTWRLPRE